MKRWVAFCAAHGERWKSSAICGSGLTYTCICLCSKMRFSEGLHVISFNSNRAALHLYNKTLGFRWATCIGTNSILLKMTAINCSLAVIGLLLWKQGWPIGERGHLPPVWSDFESWARHLNEVEFIVGSQVTSRIFPQVLQFSSL